MAIWFQLPTIWSWFWKKEEEKEQFMSKAPTASNTSSISKNTQPTASNKANVMPREPMMSYYIEWTIMPWVTDNTANNLKTYAKANSSSPQEEKLMLNDMYQEAVKLQQRKAYEKDREETKAEMVQKSLKATNPEEKKSLTTAVKLANLSDVIREAASQQWFDAYGMNDKDLVAWFGENNPDKQETIVSYLNWEIDSVELGKQIWAIPAKYSEEEILGMEEILWDRLDILKEDALNEGIEEWTEEYYDAMKEYSDRMAQEDKWFFEKFNDWYTHIADEITGWITGAMNLVGKLWERWKMSNAVVAMVADKKGMTNAAATAWLLAHPTDMQWFNDEYEKNPEWFAEYETTVSQDLLEVWEWAMATSWAAMPVATAWITALWATDWWEVVLWWLWQAITRWWRQVNRIVWLSDFRESLTTEEEKQRFDALIWLTATMGLTKAATKLKAPDSRTKIVEDTGVENIEPPNIAKTSRTSTKPTKADLLIEKTHKFTASEIRKYEAKHWETPWQTLNDKGYLWHWKQVLMSSIEDMQSMKSQKIAWLWEIKQKIPKDLDVIWMAEEVAAFEKKTMTPSELKAGDGKFEVLAEKARNWELTQLELEEIKSTFEREQSLKYDATRTTAEQKRLKNLDSSVRTKQQKRAYESWFDNIKEINREISKSKSMIDLLSKDIEKVGWLGFGDTILLAWSVIEPATLALLVSKKIINSSRFRKNRIKVINKLNWHKTLWPKVVDLEAIREVTSEAELKEFLNKPLEINKTKNANSNTNSNMNDSLLWNKTINESIPEQKATVKKSPKLPSETPVKEVISKTIKTSDDYIDYIAKTDWIEKLRSDFDKLKPLKENYTDNVKYATDFTDWNRTKWNWWHWQARYIYNKKWLPKPTTKNESIPQLKATVKAPEVDTSYRIWHQIDINKSSPITSIDWKKIDTFVDEFKRQYWYPALKSKDLNKFKEIMKNPDADIKIYRASPKNELNQWDWVTIDKTYANDIKRQNWWKVYEYNVKAKDLLYPNTIEWFNELPSLNKRWAFQYNKTKWLPVKNKSIPQPKATVKAPKDPLMAEARKYKSADEFVKKQWDKFIHETNTKFDEFDLSKYRSNTNDAWLGDGIYAQKDGTFKIEKYGDIKMETYLTPDAKIFKGDPVDYLKSKNLWDNNIDSTYTKETLPKNLEIEKVKKWINDWYIVFDTKKESSLFNVPVDNIEQAYKKSYRIINDISEDTINQMSYRDIFKDTKILNELKKDGYDGVLLDGELVVYNPSKIKTEAQLKQIREEANKKWLPVKNESIPQLKATVKAPKILYRWENINNNWKWIWWSFMWEWKYYTDSKLTAESYAKTIKNKLWDDAKITEFETPKDIKFMEVEPLDIDKLVNTKSASKWLTDSEKWKILKEIAIENWYDWIKFNKAKDYSEYVIY